MKHIRLIVAIGIAALIIALGAVIMIGTNAESTEPEKTPIPDAIHPPRECIIQAETAKVLKSGEEKETLEILSELSGLPVDKTSVNADICVSLYGEISVEQSGMLGVLDIEAVDPIEQEATDSDDERNSNSLLIDEAELDMLACVIYQEAGANYFSDDTRYKVGDVVLNRVISDKFPNSIESVLLERGQYGEFYWTGIVWPKKAAYQTEQTAVQRAYDIAYDLLTDTKHSDLYNHGYIWQAEFPQGNEWIYQEGIYFGK